MLSEETGCAQGAGRRHSQERQWAQTDQRAIPYHAMSHPAVKAGEKKQERRVTIFVYQSNCYTLSRPSFWKWPFAWQSNE